MQFIFKGLTRKINFLDINLKIIINDKLHFDVYHKPTNSFSYLHYKSCHPPDRKTNIALSLLLMTEVIDFKNLKVTYERENTRKKIMNYSFTKLFQPRKHKNNDKNVITFIRTYNPNHEFSFNKFKNFIKNTTNRELLKAFNGKKYALLQDNQGN